MSVTTGATSPVVPDAEAAGAASLEQQVSELMGEMDRAQAAVARAAEDVAAGQKQDEELADALEGSFDTAEQVELEASAAASGAVTPDGPASEGERLASEAEHADLASAVSELLEGGVSAASGGEGGVGDAGTGVGAGTATAGGISSLDDTIAGAAQRLLDRESLGEHDVGGGAAAVPMASAAVGVPSEATEPMAQKPVEGPAEEPVEKPVEPSAAVAAPGGVVAPLGPVVDQVAAAGKAVSTVAVVARAGFGVRVWSGVKRACSAVWGRLWPLARPVLEKISGPLAGNPGMVRAVGLIAVANFGLAGFVWVWVGFLRPTTPPPPPPLPVAAVKEKGSKDGAKDGHSAPKKAEAKKPAKKDAKKDKGGH